MWIVETALKRPYTFIVMAIVILLATPLAIMRTPVDVLPEIDIPVISVIWGYGGLAPQQMADRITQTHERVLTTTVNDIEHIESQSLAGIAIIKIFFQPGVNIQTAIAQVVSVSQAVVKQMPPGATPPLIIKYTASSVPVIQVGLSSKTLSEQEVFDTAINTMRPQLVTIPGIAITYPYGGKIRLLSVDLDSRAIAAHGLTPTDVVNAVNAQNLALPSGTAKIGGTEYDVELNGSPDTLAGLNDIPVKTADGATVFLREVAHVRDGFSPQTNIVKQNGQRGLMMSIYKNGGASTLDVVNHLKEKLPGLLPLLPKDLHVGLLADQSIFVKTAVQGVIHEAQVAALLTAAMLLLFLGNWRTTSIIAVSIPLSIFSSIVALHMIGETINVMTLGGLALAVGILVDDATVTIENIERHLHMGSPLYTAILDGAGEIAIPAFVSTLCICIVFVPMFFLEGVARYLFVPMAEAVVFAMLASYVLSRTLVPTLALLLMGHPHRQGRIAAAIHRVHERFNARFERLREVYVHLLSHLLTRRKAFIAVFLGFCLASCGLYLLLGRDLFPEVDTGQIKLHVRAPTGMRIEDTAALADQVDAEIRKVIPPQDLDSIIDNIGLPYSGINLSYSNSGTIGTLDSDVLISLKPDHKPSADYIAALPKRLESRFPGVEFFFQPADIITQILNFGAPAPIDVQIFGKDLTQNAAYAGRLLRRIQAIPGAADAHVHQRLDAPAIQLTMDRPRLQGMGIAPLDVAQNLLLPLSGSQQTQPAFWLNPNNHIVYNLQAQTPQYRIDSLDQLLKLPVNSPGSHGMGAQTLANLVRVSPGRTPAIVTRYNILPSVDVYASARGRDLGSVAADIQKAINEEQAQLPKGSHVGMRGQVETMRASYLGLGVGILGAIVLVYLLIVVNFQSWLDPFIIISALPAALAGIAWMLIVTGTNLSVPALTGAIMTMGVATANSILVVAFARQRMREGLPPLSAALEAGATRLRPVLMTALAMIIGMIPMAIGIGEGSEQNAPLGRAVIGGLMFATVSTLLFVPVVFASFHRYLEKRKQGATGAADNAASSAQDA
ncbi:efflux RND transporter permease subunit [Chromobacterium phragmitis]|uniref:efflux RND transporter permease subunit n=1 Tax=Chromobacterium amazonense TaxID=1382803 RepID=UPI0021B741DD|nr:efflux RND transporter permease subunit [Chromobacterium amazonense]MBM2885147.1 efflux RND transporter permease subunit [Chromobacterium amazonense]